MPPVEFEPTISAGELSQTYALDRAATGTGIYIIIFIIIIIIIILIIIIIIGISFMQGIYSYIPETNHVPTEHCVASILM